VQSILEGSIRRAGNRVRINAQLIDAASGGHLWADRYDRDLTDIFAVQDDVTHRIVDALRVTLSPADKKRAITLRPAILDKSVMMSSLIPSEKYSCSGSPDILTNGKIATDALVVRGAGLAALDRCPFMAVARAERGCQRQIRIGRSIFLTLISPPSWKRASIRLLMLSLTIEEMQMPPGSATGSSRAAMFTPSP